MANQNQGKKGFTRRDFIKMTSVGLGGLTMGLPKGLAFAAGANYPSEPIDIILPFSVGGGTDIWARTLATALSKKESLGVPVNVNNMPGAASLRGTGMAFAAKSDGQTLVNFNPPSTPWAWYLHQPGFDIEKFVGLSVFAREPGVVVVNANSKHQNFQSVFDAYKDGELKVIASLGVGTGWHIASLLMKRRFNLNWQQYVSYKGTSDVIAAIYRNEVEVGVVTAASALDGFAEKRLRVLAVIGQEDRVETYHDSPSLKELGKDPLKECLFLRSVFAPPGLPEDKRIILENALIQAQKDPAMEAHYKSLNMKPAFGLGAEAEQAIKDAIRVAEEIDLRSITKKS